MWKNAKNCLLAFVFILPVMLFGNDTPPASPPPAPEKSELSNEIHKAEESIQKTLPGSVQPSAMKIVLTLAGLILFLLLSAWALKRITGNRGGFFGSSKGIKILERKAISPKSALYLIEVQGKKVLISESQYEVRALTTLSNDESHIENA